LKSNKQLRVDSVYIVSVWNRGSSINVLITQWDRRQESDVVQNYLAFFLDYAHRLVCGSFTKDHNVSVTGSVSVFRWMGQVRPTQLDPSERASLNHWTVPTE
jgi:hypothetical protein